MNMLRLIKKIRITLNIRSQLKIIVIFFLTVAHCSTALSAIVVQNGRGLVGIINGNYSATFSGGSIYWSASPISYIGLIFYNINWTCDPTYSLMMEIDSVKGIKFNTSGSLMLVPEITFVDKLSWSSGGKYYSDTVTGFFSGNGSGTSDNLGEEKNCYFQPNQRTPASAVYQYITHQVTATGRMLIYGTGQQVSGTATLSYPVQIKISNPAGYPEDNAPSKVVDSGSYSIVVSDLGCTLTTPTLIDFGPQPANATENQALASKTVNLSVSCQQSQNPVGATLTLLARINPINYSGDSYQVNLNNSSGVAGAYVKMDMDINGASTAISFNRQLIDIGSITAAENATSFSYPVTYTLYSRGKGITGKVSGSVELSIVLR